MRIEQMAQTIETFSYKGFNCKISFNDYFQIYNGYIGIRHFKPLDIMLFERYENVTYSQKQGRLMYIGFDSGHCQNIVPLAGMNLLPNAYFRSQEMMKNDLLYMIDMYMSNTSNRVHSSTIISGEVEVLDKPYTFHINTFEKGRSVACYVYGLDLFISVSAEGFMERIYQSIRNYIHFLKCSNQPVIECITEPNRKWKTKITVI